MCDDTSGDAKEALIKSCYAIWRPFLRLAALSNSSISSASPAVTRLARHENDSPSDVTAFNQHFPKKIFGPQEVVLPILPPQ
jgi:hypothetical protein